MKAASRFVKCNFIVHISNDPAFYFILVVTQNINPCASFPCLNGGECMTLDATHYMCMCRNGYAGINCQTSISSSPFYDICSQVPLGGERCANGASCVNSYNSNSLIGNFANPQYTCICADGYTGVDCELSTGKFLENVL